MVLRRRLTLRHLKKEAREKAEYERIQREQEKQIIELEHRIQAEQELKIKAEAQRRGAYAKHGRGSVHASVVGEDYKEEQRNMLMRKHGRGSVHVSVVDEDYKEEQRKQQQHEKRKRRKQKIVYVEETDESEND